MLIGTLGAGLLANVIIGKELKAKITEREVFRAGEEKNIAVKYMITVGQDF